MSQNEAIREGILRRGRFITICLAALLAMAIAPAWAAATPASFVDDDFAGGTPDANIDVFAPGFVTLKPLVTFDEDFAGGPGLPAGWTSAPWNPGGTATVSGGALHVDGALAGPTALYNAGQSLAFRATFTADAFQHVGMGTDFNNPPWAMFSTGGGALAVGLWARTNVGGTQINDAITDVDPLVPHDYEILWSPTDVQFYVDGILKFTQSAAVPSGQRVLASDFNVAGGALTVDELSLAPYPNAYPPSGTFTSRVFDAGSHLTAWGALTGEGLLNGVTFQTRSGDGLSWSDWQSLGAGGAIQSPVRRYIQYRAILTPSGGSSPVLDRVTIGYDVDDTAPSTTITGVLAGGTTAAVAFSSPATDVARFECRLDGGAYVTCASPKVYGGLAVGNHTVAVRAIDRVGNVGAPASRVFTIPQVVPPDRSGPRVVPSPRSVRASLSGKVTFRVRCPRTEQRCKITLQLKRGRKAASSKKTVRLAGGKSAKLTLRLTKTYRKYLSTHARLKVKAVTVAYDAANNRKTTRVNATVRAPKR